MIAFIGLLFKYVQEFRRAMRMRKPFFGRKISSPRSVRFSLRSIASTRYFRSTAEMMDFSSSTANFWPMQFRGPALNGMYAYGCRPRQFSGRKWSGLNLSGFGNTSGLRCSWYTTIMAVVPAGST
uniref:Uncharacterized protein n=1 Tax=Anopheles culicifacies TaxID=139723 RepID=A0A182LRT1_9DIPT